MLLDNTGLNGVRSDLAHLDESSDKLGFVRWQWEYRRATYDLKLHDRTSGQDYFLRIATRAVEGKLENPDAILEVEAVYIGRATFLTDLTTNLRFRQRSLTQRLSVRRN